MKLMIHKPGSGGIRGSSRLEGPPGSGARRTRWNTCKGVRCGDALARCARSACCTRHSSARYVRERVILCEPSNAATLHRIVVQAEAPLPFLAFGLS